MNHFTGTHQKDEGVVHEPFYWYTPEGGMGGTLTFFCNDQFEHSLLYPPPPLLPSTLLSQLQRKVTISGVICVHTEAACLVCVFMKSHVFGVNSEYSSCVLLGIV